MELISALAQAVLGQRVSPGRLGGGRAAGAKVPGATRGFDARRASHETYSKERLEARLTERIKCTRLSL
jgi:hypothetical protein